MQAMDAPEKPVKFDELPPIINYDKAARVNIHHAYIERASREPEFSLLVPLVRTYCRNMPDTYHAICMRLSNAEALKQNTDRFRYLLPNCIEQDKATTYTFIYHQHTICETLETSPQTAYAIEQTYLQITHGKLVDLTDPRLIYDEDQEKKHKKELFDRLPILLSATLNAKRSILFTNSFNDIDSVIKPLFYNHILKQKRSYDLSEAIKRIIKRAPSNFISPQSAIIAAQEYYALVNNNHVTTYTLYDQKKEENNFNFLQKQFPEELKKGADSNKYYFNKLAFEAQALKTPQWKELLVDSLSHGNDPYFFIRCYSEPLLLGYNTSPTTKVSPKTALVIEKFIQLFSDQAIKPLLPSPKPVDARAHVAIAYNSFTSRLCTKERTVLLAVLTAHNKLIDTPNVTAMNHDRIYAELLTAIPSCPICLDPFPEYMKREAGSTIGPKKQLSCNHEICATCLPGLAATLRCPLCRAKIEKEDLLALLDQQ